MKPIRIGIFGCKRGSSYIEHILSNNGEIVAICDQYQMYIDEAQQKLGGTAKAYKDFEEFIAHPMDAVLLANYFHEHAPYAIKALERNIHVLSECTSNGTMAEGVALVRAARKSKAFYMLAENYPFMLFNQEMRRVYREGTLGQVMFAEGEYNHPGNPNNTSNDISIYLRDSIHHWRNYLPRTYYITHSLAPICYATGSKPIRVTAFPIFMPIPNSNSYNGDATAIIMTLNDDNSVFRVTGNSRFGGHENSYRICGTKGQIENVRGTDDKVMLRYNEWDIPEGLEANNFYKPELNDPDADLIKKSAHGGGDFFVIRKFFESIRSNVKPEMDELFATRLASVAILGHKSLMSGGAPFDIPDFALESDCVKYENDTASPFYLSDGTPPSIPCCSRPYYKPNEESVQNFSDMLAKRYTNHS